MSFRLRPVSYRGFLLLSALLFAGSWVLMQGCSNPSSTPKEEVVADASVADGLVQDSKRSKDTSLPEERTTEPGEPVPEPSPECSDTNSCKDGKLCQNGVCVVCKEDSECGKGKLCINDACIDGNCRTDKDCSQGQSCRENRCQNCKEDRDCAKGQLCLKGACKEGDCRTLDDCNSGQICLENRCSSCKNSGECGKPSCKDVGQDCFQTKPSCKNNSCEFTSSTMVKHKCEAGSGLCRPRCATASDCGSPTCKSGTTCTQILPVCKSGLCSTTRHGAKGAKCLAGRCLFPKNFCKESYEGIQMACAVYPDIPVSTLPSSLKLQRQFFGSSNDGTMMVFVSNSPQTVCHIAFKGVSPSNPKDLYASLSSAKRTSCKTQSGSGLGSCGSGFYNQYKSIRSKGAVTYVLNLVKNFQCPGGIRLYGHSMGGAEAQLMAAELLKTLPKVFTREYMRVYTYGSPRVFNKGDADNYEKVIDATRWVNDGDGIPAVPFPVMGYKHFGTGWFIKKKSGQYTFEKKGQDYSVSPSPSGFVKAHKQTNYRDILKSCK